MPSRFLVLAARREETISIYARRSGYTHDLAARLCDQSGSHYLTDGMPGKKIWDESVELRKKVLDLKGDRPYDVYFPKQFVQAANRELTAEGFKP